MAYQNPDDPRNKIARLKHYYKNREQYLERNRIKIQKNKEWLREFKKKPCFDCNTCYPYYIMDFDHRDGSIKIAPVSRLVSYSLEKIKREVEKCDVVCSNCHRIRTYNRQKGDSLGAVESPKL